MSGKCGKRLRASVRLWQPKKKVVPAHGIGKGAERLFAGVRRRCGVRVTGMLSRAWLRGGLRRSVAVARGVRLARWCRGCVPPNGC